MGGLGLLQIPPTDLGQVEVIKGVASALYGAGALAGVVDLISRRPGKEPIREALVNRTTLRRNGHGAVCGAAAHEHLERHTCWPGGHWQEKNDVDDDGWADLAGYSRAVVRPRLFWDNHAGRSMFATAGATWERREGGTTPGRCSPRRTNPSSNRWRRRGTTAASWPDARRRPVRADGPWFGDAATASTRVRRHRRRRRARYVLRRGRSSSATEACIRGSAAWRSSATHSTLAMSRRLRTPTTCRACLPRTISTCPVG